LIGKVPTGLVTVKNQSKPLSGRIALVTGASRGIGYATALNLAGSGAHVVAVARSAADLRTLEDAIQAEGGACTCLSLDLTDETAIAGLAAEVGKHFGKLDILFGNAGTPGPNISVEQATVAQWDEVFTINLLANWHLLRHFDPLLKKSDAPRAVFMSSSAVRQARALRGIYAASKAALESLIRAYAEANYDSPLRVNLVNPGPIRTKMRATVAPDEDPSKLDTPEQCAAEIVKLFMPDVASTGKFFDYPARQFIPYTPPSKAAPDARN
jgi:NAD(P)-dependent dehydrogenase (short-subunit alcohol dehydrogenase family)